MTIIDEIAAERQRQISAEGFAHDHDDKHTDRSLAKAAACYCILASNDAKEIEGGYTNIAPAPWWPWHKNWWKPKSHRQDLIRAGALIVAEIERLDRAAKP